MKNHGMNPYLPSWEYVPDGEPHVFGKRVYVYGSHDRFAGYAFCQNDYVCWSAPVDDLTDWQYEGIIYTRAEAAHNEDGRQCLYAPDVTRGPDGRYYLYYALNETSAISASSVRYSQTSCHITLLFLSTDIHNTDFGILNAHNAFHIDTAHLGKLY